MTGGGWPDVWRANLDLRGASRVLVRVAAFRALHLAQLDKRARKVPWGDMLRWDVAVRVEASTRKSRIYHAGAATQRIERAIRDGFGTRIAADAPVTVKARIDDDLVTISLDTTGEGLHKRGHKEWVGKAPMRETLAALILRAAGFDGTEPVVDPMCGSGTFVIEAAGIAAGLQPGRDRGFAFEHLASHDAAAVAALRRTGGRATDLRYMGSDRDQGAIRGASANADRAGVAGLARFEVRAISDAGPVEGPPGLVVVNPPYGARIGNRKQLFALYGALGRTLASRFSGWRVALVTADPGLARATALPFIDGPGFAHGGLRLRLYQTPPLA